VEFVVVIKEEDNHFVVFVKQCQISPFSSLLNQMHFLVHLTSFATKNLSSTLLDNPDFIPEK